MLRRSLPGLFRKKQVYHEQVVNYTAKRYTDIVQSAQIFHLHPIRRANANACVLRQIRSYCSSIKTVSEDNVCSKADSNLCWPSTIMNQVQQHSEAFSRNFEVRNLAIQAGMNPNDWPVACSVFQKQMIKDPSAFFRSQSDLYDFVDELHEKLTLMEQNSSLSMSSSTDFLLYPLFLAFAVRSGYLNQYQTPSDSMSKNNIDGHRSDLDIDMLRQLTDLRLPHELYPRTAGLKRKIIYHEGPTNSGKTYQALQRMKEASVDGEFYNGLYCGPLRLLALEIYERMNLDGYYTSLVTGQEKKIIPHATHVSCTVEMTNIYAKWDIAVIDEIQLVSDPQRGWAWTRAFFGLQAREIHVCGSQDAVDLIRGFAEIAGDSFELRTYKRRSPLEVEEEHLTSLRNIRPGDCVVAFSRREIYQIKRDIERATGFKCCIIYGHLPPETRSQQARLFNDPNNDYSVLVASDAVGMGLNLNIRRVIFANVKKYNGVSERMTDLSPSSIKQIAGRAGRFGTQYADVGKVTCLQKKDLKYITASLLEPLLPLKTAGLFPSSEQMEQFAAHFPGITDLGDLVDKYVLLARLDGGYFMCNHADLKKSAALLRDVPLDLPDRFTFCMAPLNTRNVLARKIFCEYAKAHANRERVRLDVYLPRYSPRTSEALRDIEIKAQLIDLYLWLSQRFPKTFSEQEMAAELKSRVLGLVEEGLHNTTYNQRSESRRKQLSMRWSTKSRNLPHRPQAKY